MSLTNAERQKAFRERKKAAGVRYDTRPGRGNRHIRIGDLPFAGVDGEGGNVIRDANGNWITDPDDRSGKKNHHYLMLRAGEHLLMNEDRSPLSGIQCLEFLADLPKDVYYVAYFFNYDVTKIVQNLPRYKLQRLMNRASRQNPNVPGHYFPVDFQGFEFDYMPSKHFKVRRKGEKRYTIVHDVGSFFQEAFLGALKKWGIGTPEELANIGDGKSGRINFGALTDETIEYNALECKLLAQLMDRFRDACKETGYIPRDYEGPGYSAAAMLDKHKVIRKEDLKAIIPDQLAHDANASYFGGRFEITAVGPIPGPVYQHDINSAYPYSETRLPCLVCGTWELRETTSLPREAIYLAYGRFSAKSDPFYLYAFPVRRQNNTIFFPAEGEGWYWSFEINAGIHQRFVPEKAWVYNKVCDHTPMDWMNGVYESRSKLGKEGKGMVVKLAANSTYGKMCQSIGNPPYANPVWGSMITSMTRAQLYEKALKLSENGRVVMLATDGIFTTSPVDKDHSPKETRYREDGSSYTHKPLGDWECTTYEEGIFIIQPGLYLLPGSTKPKTRGLPLNKVVQHADDFRSAFSKAFEAGHDPASVVVHIPLRFFMSIKQATHIGSSMGGQWLDMVDAKTGEIGKRMSFDYRNKRQGWKVAHVIKPGFVLEPMVILGPYTEGCVSKPYSKDIGAWFRSEALKIVDYGVMIDAPEVIETPTTELDGELL